MHIYAVMIAPVCAYRTGLVGMKIPRGQDKTKCDQLERLGSAYAHNVYETTRPFVWHKGRHIVWVLMATIRQDLEENMF